MAGVHRDEARPPDAATALRGQRVGRREEQHKEGKPDGHRRPQISPIPSSLYSIFCIIVRPSRHHKHQILFSLGRQKSYFGYHYL